MKNITFSILTSIFCLVGLWVHGQDLDSSAIIDRAKIEFKNKFVEKTFKDPYSYELLKITAQQIDMRSKLKNDMSNLLMQKLRASLDTIAVSDFDRSKKELGKISKRLSKASGLKDSDPDKYFAKYRDDIDRRLYLIEKIEEYRAPTKNIEAKVNAIDDILKDGEFLDQPGQWVINLDCYGANSYGGKVLGRYVFRLGLDGALHGEFVKLN